MKEENKYYTPESQEEVINWIMSEGYLPIKGEAETEGMSNFKLSFGEDFKDNLYNLVEFINSQNKTEFNNKTVEQSTALELFEIPYLNQQDIEECGFTKYREYDYSSTFKKFISEDTFIELSLFINEVCNIIMEKCNLTGIDRESEDYSSRILFIGPIKNKSKLKEVLQMIGVL